MDDVKILMQALPYIRAHHGKTFVVKFGGAVVENAEALATLAQDVSLLTSVGIDICIVHGGGPQATAMSEKLGLAPKFVEGRRITDADTLEIAKMVFAGKINLEILGALRRQGLSAVGLSVSVVPRQAKNLAISLSSGDRTSGIRLRDSGVK